MNKLKVKIKEKIAQEDFENQLEASTKLRFKKTLTEIIFMTSNPSKYKEVDLLERIKGLCMWTLEVEKENDDIKDMTKKKGK